jgi:hypothetical protein
MTGSSGLRAQNLAFDETKRLRGAVDFHRVFAQVVIAEIAVYLSTNRVSDSMQIGRDGNRKAAPVVHRPPRVTRAFQARPVTHPQRLALPGFP